MKMKGLDDYKKLAPILMGVLLVGSIYGRVDAAQEKSLTYSDYVTEARNFRDGKIYATSYEKYQEALKMDESLSLYCETAEMLLEEGDTYKIENLCKKITDKYPNEPAGYEYLISHYKDIQDYSGCFKQYEIVKKRHIKSEDIENIIASIRYEYRIEPHRFEEISDFASGYATVYENDKWSLIDENGKEVLKNPYVDMDACNGEFVAVTDEFGESYFIDLEGNRRFNYPKDVDVKRLGRMYEDIIPVYTNGKLFYYTASDGKQVLGPYEDGYGFANGVAAVEDQGKWYLITPDGTKITEGYEGFYVNTAGGAVFDKRIFADTGSGYVMLNEELNPVTDAKYEDVKGFVENTGEEEDSEEKKESYAAVKVDGKWGFIDRNGNYIIKPQYEDACSFSCGLAAVSEGGLWGYIDVNGRWVVEPYFREARTLNSKGCGFVVEPEEIGWSVIEFCEFNYN